MTQNKNQNTLHTYSRVLNIRGARLLIFRIFSDPPRTLLRPPLPPLINFRFEEVSLTLPQCYVENKKC